MDIGDSSSFRPFGASVLVGVTGLILVLCFLIVILIPLDPNMTLGELMTGNRKCPPDVDNLKIRLEYLTAKIETLEESLRFTSTHTGHLYSLLAHMGGVCTIDDFERWHRFQCNATINI
jgi:hypothetical protein